MIDENKVQKGIKSFFIYYFSFWYISAIYVSSLQRKQKEVAKENEFYMQLIQQALPAEAPSIASVCATDKEKGIFFMFSFAFCLL